MQLEGAQGSCPDQRFPERTIYELTEEGLQVGREWLTEMIAAPRNEFPEFPAALSFVFGLTPAELLTAPENLATGWGGGGEPRSGGSPISSGLPPSAHASDRYG